MVVSEELADGSADELAAVRALRLQATKHAAELEQLREALHARTEIGIAIGRVMERYDLTREQALDVLKRTSQHSNRKVRDLAAEFADGKPLDL